MTKFAGATPIAVKSATRCGSRFPNENAPEGAIAGATLYGLFRAMSKHAKIGK